MLQGCECGGGRNNWPETDVGAGLPAMRRAGGARSHRRSRCCGEHLAALTRSFSKKPKLLKLKVDLLKRRPIMRTTPTR
ncbi:hypothetical protein BL240_06195 [Pseudomonas putida]|uniref:Uncharacterized protein n=1 Tax=Pseudomonas putida TaxID=303 RepID=A0A1L5PM74_PSEPU|nr:hypothetical protein BL240_06195 [Pseudomonas putida]